MEVKNGVVTAVRHVFLVWLIACTVWDFTDARSAITEESADGELSYVLPENLEGMDFKVHIMTKRDTGDQEDDEPSHIVRTYPASEPLDPNAPIPKSPAEIFGDFETVDKIFQPTIEGESHDIETPEEQAEAEETEESAKESTEEKAKSAEGAQALTDQYGAQWPYVQETRAAGQSQDAGYSSNPGGPDQTYVERRVVLTGGNGQPTTETQYTRTEYSGVPQTYDRRYGGQVASQYPVGSSSYNTLSRQYTGGQPSRTVQGGYSTGNTGTGYQPSGSSSRGAYYDGPRYVDNNGHFIDAQGRHLDSTGRYYDTSGRYQDAVVTRTVTYETVPQNQRYVDTSGQNYRYMDQTGSSQTRFSGSSTGTGYSSGSVGGTSDSYGGTPIGGTPINSIGTQFYSSGGGSRGSQGFPATYDPVVSQISSDPTCAPSNQQVTINGLSCTNAVAQVGTFVCYNYERVSTECCERCLQVKRAEHVGCEYGDRSQQCRNINPYDCYNERNAQVCCQTCRVFRQQRSHLAESCGYGDMTPRCQEIIRRSHLCYLPDNQRLCCDTCPRLANTEEPDCQWGNQNPELCVPFDSNNQLRINCYLPNVRNICCSSCRSLRDRIREQVPGCEYGDYPIQVSTTRGVLDCGEYIRQYGIENCNGGEIARKCCYTCFRYNQRRG